MKRNHSVCLLGIVWILFRISGREPDTKHYLENKMAAENLGVNLFFKYICRKGYIRNRISERDNEVQRMLLSTECNLRIFRFWRASFCYNTYSFRTLYGYYNVCIHTGIWICGRSDRYGTFASPIFILYSGLVVFHGTGMDNVIGNMEK